MLILALITAVLVACATTSPLPPTTEPTATVQETSTSVGLTPVSEATVEATPSPESTATPTPTPEPTSTPGPTATPTPEPAATPRPKPTPTPVLDPQITGIASTNNGIKLTLQVYLPDEVLERNNKRVVMEFPGYGAVEYLMGFVRDRSPYYSGIVYVDPDFLDRKSTEWVQENVPISVFDLPERVTCTGSMRPTIHCGDRVHYEPVFPDTPLEVGDIIVFRLSDQDVDVSRDCPWLSDAWGIKSVSNLIGTQRVYIIHRIVRKVHGSYPEAFFTAGDNNFFEDNCSVKKPSILLKVVRVEKDYHVRDASGYTQAVTEHQKLLEEYGNGFIEFIQLFETYQYLVDDYNTRNNPDTAPETLQGMYERIKETEDRLNSLARRLSELPAEIERARLDINKTVAPFPSFSP